MGASDSSFDRAAWHEERSYEKWSEVRENIIDMNPGRAVVNAAGAVGHGVNCTKHEVKALGSEKSQERARENADRILKR